jgi:hypothetical protein
VRIHEARKQLKVALAASHQTRRTPTAARAARRPTSSSSSLELAMSLAALL